MRYVKILHCRANTRVKILYIRVSYVDTSAPMYRGTLHRDKRLWSVFELITGIYFYLKAVNGDLQIVELIVIVNN